MSYVHFVANNKINIVHAQDHKLRKYLSLKLNSEYLDIYLSQYFHDLKMWTIKRFKHGIKILVDYQNAFKSYISLKFWLFSVYGHGPRYIQISYDQTTYVHLNEDADKFKKR